MQLSDTFSKNPSIIIQCPNNYYYVQLHVYWSTTRKSIACLICSRIVQRDSFSAALTARKLDQHRLYDGSRQKQERKWWDSITKPSRRTLPFGRRSDTFSPFSPCRSRCVRVVKD